MTAVVLSLNSGFKCHVWDLKEITFKSVFENNFASGSRYACCWPLTSMLLFNADPLAILLIFRHLHVSTGLYTLILLERASWNIKWRGYGSIIRHIYVVEGTNLIALFHTTYVYRMFRLSGAIYLRLFSLYHLQSPWFY